MTYILSEVAMTDLIQLALEHPECERLQDFYSVGPVQRAAVESFAAALSLLAGLPEVQEDAKDAKRYRWLLKRNHWRAMNFTQDVMWNCDMPAGEVNTALDAAMKEHPQP